jgi:hypothetical protein
MVDIEFSKKHDKRFEKHFSSQMDDITLILKCHLMLEEMLRDFCSEMVSQPQFLKDSRFTFAQILDLVFGHALARMASNFLTVLSGFLVQVQRQRSYFVKARHLFFLPSRVAVCRFPGLLEC